LKKIIPVIILFLLASCATTTRIPAPTAKDIQNADYGAYPSDHERIITSYLQGHLADPDSVKELLFSDPQAGWYQYSCDYFLKPPKFGYLCWATFNAKNKKGEYTGYSNWLMIIKDEQVIFSRNDVLNSSDFKWGYK